MNFGPSAGSLADGLSKTVGIRKDLMAGGGRWVMGRSILCLFWPDPTQMAFPSRIFLSRSPAGAGNAP